jgi:uncharacterized membrane protein (Fun14 family)
MKDHHTQAARGLSRAQLALIALFALALIGSLALRWTRTSTPTSSGIEAPAGASGLRASGGGAGEHGDGASEPDALGRALPLVTEASLIGLVGFALGYAARHVLRTLLIVLALAFVCVQGLVWLGVAEISWSSLAERWNALVLDAQERLPAREALLARVPSVGTLLAGLGLGFKRG